MYLPRTGGIRLGQVFRTTVAPACELGLTSCFPGRYRNFY
jgi:hypothetical protein